MWEIPAGMRDVEGEPPEATAARELEEEAGYRASRLVGLGVFHPLVGLSDSTHHLFAALDLVPVPPRRESVEERHLEVAVVGLDEAFAMIERGELTDGKTVIGLYRVRERLGSLLGAP
jgi:ADP-ribose pyrophosphatase